jgi:serine-type D-Ala-D-Ala carboxypeptidase (penicillin-binding protein 5/6)
MPAPAFTGWLNLLVLTPRLNSRNWRCGRCLAFGLGAVTALTSAAVFMSAPAQAQELAVGAAQTNAARPATAPPSVSLRGGELIDATTGAVLWGKDDTVGRPMGSITKVMTALLVLRAGDLSREIKVTKAAIRYVHKDGASSAGLIAGDRLTARQLLEGMLVPSGCDAAYLLATAYGPGRNAFVAKMNAMAQSLGMTSTHFSWFDGMPYPTELSTYSSPADLIRLGERAMRYPTFRSIVAQSTYYVPATHLHHSYLWRTTDNLIGSYQGAVGIKTGNTKAAGHCLLFEARRDGITLIGVVLHANPVGNPNAAFRAARRLLNWGFRQV